MLTVLSVVILGVAVVAGLAGGAVGYTMARRSDLPLRVARLERELNVRGETGGRTAESRPTASPGDAGARTRSADSAAASTGAAPGAATAAPGGSSRAAGAGHETTTGNAPAQPPTGVAGAGWWQWLSERIRRGNTPAQVGTVLLLVGVGLLVRLAAGSGYLPVEVRLAGAAAGGLVLLFLGWWLRHRYRDYALIIQGAGLGVIYLTAFAAVQLYAAVAAVPAFFALVVFTAATVVMAVAQNAFWLATFALAGGFLAPLIAASGGGSHILLFSYYLVLNAGILGVAWFRAWRSLNLLGFAFTVVLGGLWGAQRYEPGLFASVEPFLIAHVVLYCAVAILFALRQPPHLRGLVDGTLVFGTPVVGLALQASMVAHIPYGLAVSAAAAGGFYVLMASAIWRYCGRTVGQLTAAFAAIGLVCATLAIPLAVDGRWTAAAWALESGGIIWVALRQQRRLMLLFGLALQVLAGLAFLNDLPATVGSVPLLNHVFMGCVLIAGVGIATGWQLHHRWPFRIPGAPVATAFMLWATAWWLGGAALQIEIHLPDRLHVNTGLAVAVGTVVVATLAAARLSWPTLQWLGAALLPALGLVTLAEMLPKLDAGGGLYASHPLGDLGYLVWPLAFVGHYFIVSRIRDDLPARWLGWLHAGGLWLAVFWLTWETAWLLAASGGTTWALAAWGALPALAVMAVTGRLARIPDNDRLTVAYLETGLLPLAGWLVLWSVAGASASTGAAAPLVFVPVANPVDAASLLALLAVAQVHLAARRLAPNGPAAGRWMPRLVAGMGLLWLSSAIARCVHHWGSVPYRTGPLLESAVLQTSWSLAWGTLALAAMVVGCKGERRWLWMAGAGLCAAVVVKLVIVDLAGTGSLARIVSFIGVGLLLLVVGYAAPLPPRERGGPEA